MVKPPQGKGRRIGWPSWRVVLKVFWQPNNLLPRTKLEPGSAHPSPSPGAESEAAAGPWAGMEHGQLLLVLPWDEQSQGAGMSGRGPPARLGRGERLCLGHWMWRFYLILNRKGSWRTGCPG